MIEIERVPDSLKKEIEDFYMDYECIGRMPEHIYIKLGKSDYERVVTKFSVQYPPKTDGFLYLLMEKNVEG